MSIAPSLIEPERAWWAEPVAAPRVSGRTVLMVFAFTCLFPYPALTIGNNTGVQASQLIALFSIPWLVARPPSRAFLVFVLLTIPRAISAFVAVANTATLEAEIIPKELVSVTIATLPLWTPFWLARRSVFQGVVVGVALAILPHVLIGLYQVYSFSNEEFPLLFLYRNPSFKSMELWSEDFALYIKRPFGLFPEPSAMAASIGPWLVVMVGLLAERTHRLNRGARWLCATAVLGGLLLLALSRSGLTPLILVALTVVAIARVRDWARSSGPRAVFAGLAVVVSASAGMAYVVSTLSTNLDARIESSWGLRSMSIVTALTANTEPLDLIFGIGPGQSTAVVRRLLAHIPLEKGEEMAVWSLSVAYYMETGLIGAAALLILALMLIRVVMQSSARLLGFASLGVWAAGVTVATSYPHLSSLWLFLGVLLEWDRVFVRSRAGGQPR